MLQAQRAHEAQLAQLRSLPFTCAARPGASRRRWPPALCTHAHRTRTKTPPPFYGVPSSRACHYMAPPVGPARHPLREKQAKDAVPPLSSLVAFFVRTASSSSFTASAPLLSAAAAIARAKPTAPPRMLSHSRQRAPPQALASTAPWTARTEPGAPLSRTFPGAARLLPPRCSPRSAVHPIRRHGRRCSHLEP